MARMSSELPTKSDLGSGSQAIARRIAARFPVRSFNRGYAALKLRSDPLYEAVQKVLQDHTLPVLDVGCGLGLLAFYLRESGLTTPLLGLDFDVAKITAARAVAASYEPPPDFRVGDVRAPWAAMTGNVCLLDTLQYLPVHDSAELMLRASRHVAPGGLLIIRAALQDDSWRFALTRIADRSAHLISWMKSIPRHYHRREDLEKILATQGLRLKEARPLWGRTPFNSYLLVFERPDGQPHGGSTQA